MQKLDNGTPFQQQLDDSAVDYLIPDLVYSVCKASDISTWKQTSQNLLKYVDSKNYLVIVPDDEVLLFRSITDPVFRVVPETVYIGDLKSTLLSRMPDASRWRLGWYLQQFIKLAVLYEAKDYENYVIWDADTVPIKKIDFFRTTGDVEFFVGTEAHHPYFEFTEKLLDLSKIAPFSFIAQCFPCKGNWVKCFFKFVEEKFNDNYVNAIINLINFNELSGFSEYETVGQFIFNRFQQQIIVKQKKWLRQGTALIGSSGNIDRQPYSQLIKDFEHITFERSQQSFSILAQQDKDFIKYFLEIEASTKQPLENFLDEIFLHGKVRAVVQIGFNNDIYTNPLRKYFFSPGSLKVTLVEPNPYYALKIQEFIGDRNDISVIHAAVGSAAGNRDLFFMHPDAATEINGDGAANDWANGCASFDKSTLINWIKEKAPRENYFAKIDDYINSIGSLELRMLKTETVLHRHRCGLLVVINVHGFELDILNGIDYDNLPQWILIEDGFERPFELSNFFLQRGFQWVAGTHLKLFARV